MLPIVEQDCTFEETVSHCRGTFRNSRSFGICFARRSQFGDGIVVAEKTRCGVPKNCSTTSKLLLATASPHYNNISIPVPGTKIIPPPWRQQGKIPVVEKQNAPSSPSYCRFSNANRTISNRNHEQDNKSMKKKMPVVAHCCNLSTVPPPLTIRSTSEDANSGVSPSHHTHGALMVFF